MKGAEGINNNCQVFIFCQGGAEAGKIQPSTPGLSVVRSHRFLGAERPKLLLQVH